MDREFIIEIKSLKFIKCCKLSLAQKKFIIYFTLAALAGSGMILILLGCRLWSNGWWALFVLFGIFFCALPDILFNRLCVSKNNHNVTRNKSSIMIEEMLFVIAGFFTCVPYTLPFVLMHNKIISGNTAGMVVSGSFLIMVSSLIFMKLIYKRRLVKLFHKNIDEQGNPISSDEDEKYFLSSFLSRDADDSESDYDGRKEEF